MHSKKGLVFNDKDCKKEKQKIKKTDPENSRCAADGFRYCGCSNSCDGCKCKSARYNKHKSGGGRFTKFSTV